MTYDAQASGDIERNPGSVFAWILLASWIYYEKAGSHNPLLSDVYYDHLCRYALEHYDELHHDHAKPYIDEGSLQAGSLHSLGNIGYPYWAVRISERLSNNLDSKWQG